MTYVPDFEELDVSCEQSALAQIEDVIELLGCKLTQISQEGRISRAAAAALVERYAVQFDERYPINSFTISPSATNLSIAQEGIIASTMEFLMNLIKAAGELLMKIFRWVIDFLSFRKIREKRALKKGGDLKEVKKATDELKSAGIHFPAEEQALIDQAFERYQNAYSGLSHEMLTEGRLFVFLTNAQPLIMQVGSTISLRIEHLLKILERLPKSESEDEEFEANATVMYRSGIGHELRRGLEQLHVNVGNAGTSPKALMQALIGHMTTLSLQKDISPPSMAEVEDIISRNSFHFLDPLVSIPEYEVREILQRIKELTLFQTNARVQTTQRGHAVVRKLVQAAVEEALSVQVFLDALGMFSSVRSSLIEAVWNYSTTYYQATYSGGMSDRDPEKREAAHRITTRLQERLK